MAERAHPWIFMLGLGTGVEAVIHGDIGTTVVAAAVVVWTLRGASSPARSITPRAPKPPKPSPPKPVPIEPPKPSSRIPLTDLRKVHRRE